MDKKIEIKEEDSLTDDIASQNEREFFQKIVSMNTSTDTVLLDTNCDIAVKTETKSETTFVKYFVKQMEAETASCSYNCEIGRANEVKQRPLFSDVASQNKEEVLPENPVVMDKKYNNDNEICNKIEIKEEPWQLETETSLVWDNTKDVYLPTVKSSRFLRETVAGAIHCISPLLSAECQERNTTLYDGMDRCKFQYQESDVREILTAVEDVHSEEYEKRGNEDVMYIQPSFFKPKSLGTVHKGPRRCSICAKRFINLWHLKRHQLIHEGKKPHQCKVCGKSFTQLSNLKTHNLIHEGKKEHQCKVCNKTFTHPSTLSRHNSVHEGKKSHHCKVCDKSFTRLSYLKTHNLVHEGQKEHQCKLCNKSFTDSSKLRRHHLVHEGNKLHQCKVCDKSFNRLSNLKTHNLIHEGKKTQQCKVCDKRFTLLSGLRKHSLVHEDKKPYICKICDKSFTQLQSLKRHNLIHEGKKSYQCKVCNKSFTLSSTLKRHNLVHEGEEPHHCKLCDKRFTLL